MVNINLGSLLQVLRIDGPRLVVLDLDYVICNLRVVLSPTNLLHDVLERDGFVWQQVLLWLDYFHAAFVILLVDLRPRYMILGWMHVLPHMGCLNAAALAGFEALPPIKER